MPKFYVVDLDNGGKAYDGKWGQSSLFQHDVPWLPGKCQK